jgi:tetratricopeptide (TPR) repeat protein
LKNILRQAGGLSTGLVFILLLLSPSGCSGLRGNKYSLPADTPEEILLADVPFFAQEAFQCGPASLAMVLVWTGLELSSDDLTAAVYTPTLQGSLQPSLISAARQYGRVAYQITGTKELFAEVSAGHPVIVLQNLGLSWYPKYHYAVVIGYENGGSTILLHSGKNSAAHLSGRVFENTWARADYWGLLVLPTDELPVMATEEKYLGAVAGLERAGQFEAATAAYKTALTRWPESLSAWMGLGNSFYAQGDLSSAADAYNQAMQLHPSNGIPLNNLAQVLWEQGEKKAALEKIRQAIKLGGPYKSVFEETLQDFEQSEK